MLKSLRIQNLALVPQAHLQFGPGLSVLTGESGSGKSILLDALALVTGCSRSRIRPSGGTASGFVEAEFFPSRLTDGSLSSSDLRAALEENGLLEACTPADEPLVLARRIDASGRTRCFIQGQTVARSTLSRVGACLLELCGQSEAHSLRTPAAQLAALDRFGRLLGDERELGRRVGKLRAQEAALQALTERAAEAERRRDFVEFQLSELSKYDLSDIDARRTRLDELTEATQSHESHQQLVDSLQRGDKAVLPQLKWLSARLSSSLRGDHQGQLSSAISTLDSVVGELSDLAQASSCVLSHSDRDREEATRLSEEFSALWSLAQKHRISVDELGERKAKLEAELASFARLTDELDAARQALEETRRDASEHAERLHAAREKAARLLDRKIKKELHDVGLSGAQFETHVTRGDLGPTGITQLSFSFSANPGHAPQPLSRVASGGELSRVLLCFRLATDSAGAMLVFDEIDAGAGGKTAEKIANSLKRAGKAGQVLCVTHWPQVAGIADQQYSVKKEVHDGTALCAVHQVSGEERLQEISRMLGGTAESARKHASALVNAPVAA
jgi:DNA repair protein RecN (Recombination protein N)